MKDYTIHGYAFIVIGVLLGAFAISMYAITGRAINIVTLAAATVIVANGVVVAVNGRKIREFNGR